MRTFLVILLGGAAIWHASCAHAGDSRPPRPKAFYTRLPYDDQGFTGKYADIVVELPARGRFVFGRERGYQPCWMPALGGTTHSVARLIPRRGDGPDERPDDHNIASHAAIVAQTDSTVTVHWRYAPDITTRSFTDFRTAYDEAGTPAPFYAEYADEYFVIHADGTVKRTVKRGCERLDDWTDPANRIEQTLRLLADRLEQDDPLPARLSGAGARPVGGAPLKTGHTDRLACHWRFDEGTGDSTRETRTGRACEVRGAYAHWRPGVSGACLSFDSYSNAVAVPAAACPTVPDACTVSAWIAIQEYPFNLAAIADHLDGARGYLLGIDARGRVEFRVGDGTTVRSLTAGPLPLYEWVHVAAVAKAGTTSAIYLNGRLAATADDAAAFVDAPQTPLTIGMTTSVRQFPRFAERDVTKRFRTCMVFSGLIDEVKLFDKALAGSEVLDDYTALRPSAGRPLEPWVLPAGPERSPGFHATCTTLAYSPEWDGLWRVGDFADIVVTFADTPWRYVFWRGTRYLPSLVTAHGRGGTWSNDQGAERYDREERQCYEHMSDMLCRFSHARIIHRSDARVVVHWRNASASIEYRWPAVDAHGRGIWTDEYWTIYPDGVSVRHQVVHNATDKAITAELNQNEILLHPGQAAEDVLGDDGVVIADTRGRTVTIDRAETQPRRLEGDWNLQLVNLTGVTKQFEIGEIGAWSQTYLHNDVFRRGWNHYPVQLIPSDGTRVHTYDRPASACPATFHEVRHTDGNHIEAMVLYGLTDGRADGLTALNRSWNFAPELTDVRGCEFQGYERRERAFKLRRTGDTVAFTVDASRERPLERPAFVIAGWPGADADVTLTINGRTGTRDEDFRAGVEVDTDGSQTLVVWLPLSATEATSLEIAGRP